MRHILLFHREGGGIVINVALFGNPNVGKTTLFNTLTGFNQYVGNWPGVTVDKKKGFFDNVMIMDLPGIYAFDTFSNEEKVSKECLLNDNVDVILNIVDASNLSRNLYLTIQLKSFNKPIILALNMIDICDKKGIEIDFYKLAEELEVEIVPISAEKNIGIDKLKKKLKGIHVKKEYLKNSSSFKNEKEIYGYIEKVLKKTVNYKKTSRKKISNIIDKYIMLNPVMAFPIFILVILVMFKITFSWIGRPLSDLLTYLLNNQLIPYIESILSSEPDWFKSLIVDGIVSSVGGILALLPIILVMFTCITIIEDSGYMARMALIMDKVMRKMGLSGKGFIPMILGFGCSVPAIMAARTLESEKDRKLAALLVAFSSCNAKLPVYLVFTSVFFKGYEGIVIASLYVLGIFTAFLSGILINSTVFKNKEEPFLLEIPEYRIPRLKNIINVIMDKGIEFLKKAGTIIFAMSIIIWFLSNFNFNLNFCSVDKSILAEIGEKIAPLFKYLGFGNWQASISLLCGLLAKETVISSMQVIYGGSIESALKNSFSPVAAYSFLVFVLLYVSCISTCGTIKKEYGIKYMCTSIIFQLCTAWLFSFCIFNIGTLIFKFII